MLLWVRAFCVWQSCQAVFRSAWDVGLLVRHATDVVPPRWAGPERRTSNVERGGRGTRVTLNVASGHQSLNLTWTLKRCRVIEYLSSSDGSPQGPPMNAIESPVPSCQCHRVAISFPLPPSQLHDIASDRTFDRP
ncbi:hypothetical protein C8Q74DRAFT_697562 [Fomes fomentarius]|nr:hypothetical protein C8Q74DRAFT_697562 [Fomes fomentarius]